MLDFLADAFSDRGALLKEDGKLDAALVNLDDALLLSPRHRLALNNRGAVLTDLGRPTEALIDFDTGLGLNPHDTKLSTNRGNDLIRLDRLEEAVKSHDRAIAIEPDRQATLLPRAVALHYLRRFDESLADFGVVLSALPDDPGVRYNASLVHLTIGNYVIGWSLFESRWGMHAVPEVMFEVLFIGFEHVERFVLHLPWCPPAGSRFRHGASRDRQVCDIGVVVSPLALHAPQHGQTHPQALNPPHRCQTQNKTPAAAACFSEQPIAARSRTI